MKLVEHLNATDMEIVGHWPRLSILENRRMPDFQYHEYCFEKELPFGNEDWGLPRPNIDAAYKSLGKYCKGQPYVEEDKWLLAVAMMQAEFLPIMGNSDVLSVQEVLTKLDMSTSAGFPASLDASDKRTWLEVPENVEWVTNVWERAKSDLYTVIWTNSLKEEVRATEKIKENKIRTFTASPLELTVLGGMLFMDMNQKFYDANNRCASTVGMDVFHGGWNELYERLNRHPIAYELDESSYDSSIFQLVFSAIYDFRLGCLKNSAECGRQAQSFYRNIVWSFIITADGWVVMKKTGNPSGSANTIVDNTLCLYLLLSYVWVLVVPKEWRTHQAFSKHVELALCGDDNTWTVSEEANVFFNARVVATEFSKIGLITTSPCYDARKLSECSYLSRTFDTKIADVRGRMLRVPVLDRKKFLASLCFSKKPADPVYSLIRAVGIYQVSWADLEMRSYMKMYIHWLVRTFGGLYRTDPDWRGAIQGYKGDYEMSVLYLYPRSAEKINKPGKNHHGGGQDC